MVADFFKEVFRLGSVRAWWHEHQADVWEGEGHASLAESCSSISSIVGSSNSPLRNCCVSRLFVASTTWDLTRPWRARDQEEYDQFCRSFSMVSASGQSKQQALFVLTIFVLFRYGLTGLRELGRPLSAEELHQVLSLGHLVTTHLGHGIFLPYPLSADIRVGHVVLDEIRFFCWQYASARAEKSRWNEGPQRLSLSVMNSIERALAAPVYTSASGIFPRRPETERLIVSPWRMQAQGVQAQNGYALLPSPVQQQLMAYLTYCHQEQGRELGTLYSRVRGLMHFFAWAYRQGRLFTYPQWDRETAQDIFRAYANSCVQLRAATRREYFMLLASFFATLADLEYPIPAGYQLFSQLERDLPRVPRSLPREEVLDRVFREGVCQLSYDPFARLALTIQYYCGTRLTETCDLHLFCILEDQEGHASLLIPKGKTKQERPFPIVELGMGPLLQYMDEVVALRLAPDGTSRTLGRTNFRYLKDDPERAKDWHYLFDRIPGASGEVRGRRWLSSSRVGKALREALLIAAKSNPEGLFLPETYNPVCQHQRKKGQQCGYFVAKAGITICPCCGSSLSGERGVRCRSRMAEDFRCDGEARTSEAFCPKCDMPLAQLAPITSHVFRHNSVSRAHRAGVPLAQNMQLHGHRTIPVHLRYLHLFVDETAEEVSRIFAHKRVQEVRLALGEDVELKNVCPVSLDQYLSLTLQRSLKRRTCGIWGGFWAGALAQRGVVSPISVQEEIVIPEECSEHAVAQYWYEALGLAVSEVAFEAITAGKWQAQVPAFLDRQKIDALVQFHVHVVQGAWGSVLLRQRMEADLLEQRRDLGQLAEILRPWWQQLGTIDRLVELMAPGGGYAYQRAIPATEERFA